MSKPATVPHRFCVRLSNLDGALEAEAGVTYPHLLFGSHVALRNEAGELLLPGLSGEVHVQERASYSVESVQPR